MNHARFPRGIAKTQPIENSSTQPSTTLAVSFERSWGSSTAMRASVWRSAPQGYDDGLPNGRQRRLRRAGGDSFFPRSRRRGGDVGGRRRRSSSSAHGGEGLAMIAPRSGRDRVLP